MFAMASSRLNVSAVQEPSTGGGEFGADPHRRTRSPAMNHHRALPTTDLQPTDEVFFRFALTARRDGRTHLTALLHGWAGEFDDVLAGATSSSLAGNGLRVIITIHAGGVRDLMLGTAHGRRALTAVRALILRLADFTPTPLITPVGLTPALDLTGRDNLLSSCVHEERR